MYDVFFKKVLSNVLAEHTKPTGHEIGQNRVKSMNIMGKELDFWAISCLSDNLDNGAHS